eukprot:TRINITY_DN6452_c0_g2_i2.p1 TRINITY_DN6452_c0_g2~~TRINITY_DN6452_c0_g2_i2.p1  ORF type:complete len:108 (-),score=17.35 TRINITY_DN6452_c0_g2_i2:147-470(-)
MEGKAADETLKKFEETFRFELHFKCDSVEEVVNFHFFSKYKYLEIRLTQSKASLKGKIPEIKKTLETALFLQDQKVCRSSHSLLFKYFEAFNLLFFSLLSLVCRETS